MPTSLRAFLMLKLDRGDWDIHVSHSLEDVARAWDCRPTAKGAGVLHVGFERRIARSFDELANHFPDRLLLTPAAKGALPASFITSRNAVGHVAEEPIYLALEGWGYSASEPIASKPTPVISSTGWLGEFLQNNPDEEEAVLNAEIVDDNSYHKNESTLPRRLRTELGVARSRFLTTEHRDDPTALARSAPPWLSNRELSQLDLTVRIGNVFRLRAITHVCDLGLLTIADLLGLQNFGRTSIRHLVQILDSALKDGPPATADEVLQAGTKTLLEAVHQSLASCSERERDIVVRRMGLGRPSETLEEIGETYGVTRERIRQIEAKVVTRLVQRETWDDLLAAKLDSLLADREYPLPLIGAEALDLWFEGFATYPEATRYLIANMCNASVNVVEIEGVDYLSFINQDAWKETVETARRLLSSGVEQGWSEAECRNYIVHLLPDNAREYSGLLWDKASRWCHFADDETRTLISYGRGVNQIVEAVLAESDAPLHYSDIATRAAERSGRDLDERRVHNAAAEVGYLFGPGTYGTLAHRDSTRETWEAIADEAAEIVSEGDSSRQWHTSELIESLRNRSVPMPSSFDKYRLDIALKEAGHLTSLGRMVWAGDSASNGARVDVRQAIIAILRDAGGPLLSTDLRQRLVAVRGINQGMPFQVVDPIIKLSSQLWALNDRDLSVKKPEQPAYLDAIAAKLRSAGAPVHISRCSETLGDEIPPRAMFCLAASDPRFQVTPIGI